MSPDNGLLENLEHIGLTEMSAAQANSFLKQKAIEHSFSKPKKDFVQQKLPLAR